MVVIENPPGPSIATRECQEILEPPPSASREAIYLAGKTKKNAEIINLDYDIITALTFKDFNKLSNQVFTEVAHTSMEIVYFGV